MHDTMSFVSKDGNSGAKLTTVNLTKAFLTRVMLRNLGAKIRPWFFETIRPRYVQMLPPVFRRYEEFLHPFRLAGFSSNRGPSHLGPDRNRVANPWVKTKKRKEKKNRYTILNGHNFAVHYITISVLRRFFCPVRALSSLEL
ncbi:hypothetical protein L798_00366 [Zootermopsis nevadensis]|uniref:Uncharacterized protein n=1 Tax=Zootermopsis nevadensis TaxID=136037 RepID=A0A067QKK5_ZOONE|nr:hypothetical protein L798_00366 [Zootermopsis nevadensis]